MATLLKLLYVNIYYKHFIINITNLILFFLKFKYGFILWYSIATSMTGKVEGWRARGCKRLKFLDS